ncbi:hypothetical protein ACGFNU_20930 [Spirillospora sp. NPDC048911]|uniref:hypothetical protein n=1 Tax=Spirillospora sp. NPDC048911 TaxID=3364527 RepID=UPI00372392B9
MTVMATKKTPGAVRRDRLAKLNTSELIEQYELAISSYTGRYTNTSPRQKRINYVVDLLGARADDGDVEALAWLAPAKKASATTKARVDTDRPDLYLRSSTGMLHLRAEGFGIVEEDGLSSTWARCGWHTDLGSTAIPARLFADGEYRLCRRCTGIEP